ncbi:hypothetical protein BGZ81_006415 [Podila clonocystis]|nr:hypothetical protein BGZ81_006415 [Podila clonocystis]
MQIPATLLFILSVVSLVAVAVPVDVLAPVDGIDPTSSQAPTTDINGEPIHPEANVPADAQRVEVVSTLDDSTPKRDSHISLTNGVLNGAKLAFAGVTGIDNNGEN